MNKINHVAIIMDGNGRWALKKNKPRNFGHQEGLKNISSLIGIEAFTSLNYLSCYENQLTSLDLSYIITDIQ